LQTYEATVDGADGVHGTGGIMALYWMFVARGANVTWIFTAGFWMFSPKRTHVTKFHEAIV